MLIHTEPLPSIVQDNRRPSPHLVCIGELGAPELVTLSEEELDPLT